MTSVQSSMVAVEGVTKTYGEGANAFTALRDVSLHIERGSSVALLGRSGSGKSTLLNLLGAVDRPTAGTVHLDGINLTTLSDGALALFRRRRLGYVFQSFHLVPSLTVFDNVSLPWTLDRTLTADRRDQVHQLLEKLGVDDKSRRYPEELSGGQQQRVAIARAVVHSPALVLADEPTGNLDALTGETILDLLGQLQRDLGITLVMATHSAEAARRCARRITLSDGQIIADERTSA